FISLITHLAPIAPYTLSLHDALPIFAHEEVDELQLPGEEGFLGVLPGHTPMLVALKVGPMWYRKGTEKTFGFIGFGFAEILPDRDRKSTRLNSSHVKISYAVFCLKKK